MKEIHRGLLDVAEITLEKVYEDTIETTTIQSDLTFEHKVRHKDSMTYKYNSNQKMPLELVRNIVIFTEFSIENSCMEVDTDNNKEIELNIRIKYNDNKSNISLSTTSVDEDVNKLFNEVSTIVEKG